MNIFIPFAKVMDQRSEPVWQFPIVNEYWADNVVKLLKTKGVVGVKLRYEQSSEYVLPGRLYPEYPSLPMDWNITAPGAVKSEN
jgi:hypothetical protein